MTDSIPHPRPQGVRIARRSGEIIPVELAWEGVDEETGCAQWLISTPVDVANGDQILVDVMPPLTGLTFGPNPKGDK